MTPQEQINEINRKLDAFLQEYYRNNNTTSQIFTKKVYFKGGIDLTSDDVLLGTASGKLGLYGVATVVKAAAISAPSTSGAAYSQGEAQSAVNAINSIRVALQNIGITA